MSDKCNANIINKPENMKKITLKNSEITPHQPSSKNYKDSRKKQRSSLNSLLTLAASNRVLGHASNYLEPYSGTVPGYGNLFLKLDKYTVPFVV